MALRLFSVAAWRLVTRKVSRSIDTCTITQNYYLATDSVDVGLLIILLQLILLAPVDLDVNTTEVLSPTQKTS